MSPLDRRSFLANGMRASAAVAVAGAVDLPPAGASRPEFRSALAAPTAASPLTARGLTVNGVIDPIGVDPDDCSFAWLLRSSGRGVVQEGYRITVRNADPLHEGVVWDSGAVPSARQAFILYGGPKLAADTAYTWSVEVEDARGEWSAPSPGGRFVTALRQADWAALWLHPAATSPQPNQVTYLRKVVTPPPGKLRRATSFISAAHTYQFFLNGVRVDYAPSFSYPDEQYSRSVDLTSAIRPGEPVALGVLHRWYGAGQGRPLSAPGLIFQLSLVYDDGRRIAYGSDGTWKELPAEWLPSPLRNTDGSDFVEWVDGRAHPTGWATPTFDDTRWTAVGVRGPAGTAPFTAIFAQRTQIAEHAVKPVSLRTLPNGSVVADFGAVYAAKVRVRFAHGQDGWTVPMHVGYLLDPDGQVSTTHGTQETNLSFSYITRQGAQEFEALTYLGFRYLQIDNPGEALGRDQVEAVATHAVMPDVPMATFSTGDRMLNAVWKLNARSCLYCTHEQFVDTPTREKGPFLWDAANESEGIMRTYGDQNMTWQGLRDVARGQARFWPDGRVNAVYPNGDGARDYPTFTARYPEWLWRYYVATGDLDTTVLLYPVVQRVSDYLWSGIGATTGLLTGFADGSDGDPVYGYDQSVSADTASNVLGVNAFNRIAQLAKLAGDDAGALVHVTRAQELTAAINARLARSDGVYIDGVKADGSRSSHASQEANALALAYGVVPPNHLQAVAAYVVSLGISLGPNHGLELLRALAQAGLWSDMVHTLTDATTPGWAHIVAVGGTFTWETWVPSDLIGDSMSHGWGSSALVAMQESLLGVTLMAPDESGTVHASINPPTSGLDGARGSVPSIAGPIAVTWRNGKSALSLDAVIPANARATILFPTTDFAAVKESGRAIDHAPAVTFESIANGKVVVTVGSGSYRFTVGRS
jgi:alpha-L-rhamnosidase